MRRVAEERNASECPPVHGIAIHHRVTGRNRHCGPWRRVEPFERPVLIGGIEILEPARLAPVHDRDGLLDLRNPVDELTAFRIDVVADRIDDQRAVPRADPGNASSGKNRPTPCHAAPEIGAAVTEGAFIAMELTPHGGMDAVARHENIARLKRQSRTIRG
jgi:hypothetical protein